ncbi:MAG: processing protein [Chloroflexota bacterium]|nr:processing protein [Chloroflexota bacterium]
MLGIGRHEEIEAPPPVAFDGGADPERDAWIVLASVDGLGPVGFGSMLARFGSGVAILDVARRPGGAAALVDPVDPRRFVDEVVAARIALAAADPAAIVGRVRESGVAVITLEDSRFPRRLFAIELPPHLLFVRGDPAAMERAHAVAVVGTRRPTELGRRLAARVAAALADSGASVVSGLAMGIDGAAHAACVAAGVPTVAVLGSGHGRLFPRAHAGLADGIVAGGGAVVSEFHPDLRATRGTFPRRNRLISGLSDATVVVEAPLRSGALITASWALEQGRGCYLVPGPIDAPTSAGCLAFLRDYTGVAQVVATIPDLIEDLELLGTAEGGPRTSAEVELGLVERALVGALARGATTTDDLVRSTGQPVATILGALTLLEMRGLVTVAYGRHRLAGRLAGAAVA